MPSLRGIHWLIPVLLTGLLPGTGTLRGAGEEPPIQLPDLKVTAQVPLIKVAEFKMRETRFAAAAVSDGRYIYIIGGQDRHGTLLDTIERFDPQTGTSEEFARMKHARLWHRAVIHDNRIYVLGGSVLDELGGSMPMVSVGAGRAANGSIEARAEARIRAADRDAAEELVRTALMLTDTMEILDLSTRQISAGPVLPEPRSAFGCVVIGDEIHVIGGKRTYKTHFSRSNTVRIYSPATGQWRSGVPMPTPRETAAVAVHGPFIVVPGGYNGIRALAVVEAFNPRENTWLEMPPLVRTSSAHAVAFLGHQLFLFGNYEAPGELMAYDLRTRQSAVYTLQYTPARHAAAVVVDGKIYVIGGKESQQAEALDCIQVFAPPAMRISGR